MGPTTSFSVSVEENGQSQAISLAEATQAHHQVGLVWTHIYQQDAEGVAWLQNSSGLDPMVVDALLAEQTRPRFARFRDGALINLRGVNLNPNARPEDMVSIRLWVEEGRVISVFFRHLRTVREICDRILAHNGPRNSGQFVQELATELADRTQPIIESLDQTLSALEELSLKSLNQETHRRLAVTRQRAIRLKRYIVPQREALSQLSHEDLHWLTQRQRASLQNLVDQVTRDLEELEDVRDRAALLQEEAESRRADDINRKLYVLSVVTVIFMPLTFLTGLLGINVGGIPGAASHWAFAGVTGLLLVGAVVELIYLRIKGWL
ncbi:MAG: zinc transporter ZntB [Parvibaculaceae bacterium]|nr:zinc transporter ZntB [Parvibaculaceae bacterium]